MVEQINANRIDQYRVMRQVKTSVQLATARSYCRLGTPTDRSQNLWKFAVEVLPS
jgi:hypothetical protein